MSEPTPDAAAIDRARRNAADLVAALAFVALGVATFYGAWTMPRLENRGIHPLTAPGLLPGVLAAALILCGVLLAAKAWRGPAVRAGLAGLVALGRSREAARTGAALALILVYTLGLVGWLPFWLASAIFVFSFIVTFEVVLASEPPVLWRSLAWAAAVALVSSIAVVIVFERAFLVRLP
jgi:putative tricarboxylic transport membrane protein